MANFDMIVRWLHFTCSLYDMVCIWRPPYARLVHHGLLRRGRLYASKGGLSNARAMSGKHVACLVRTDSLYS